MSVPVRAHADPAPFSPHDAHWVQAQDVCVEIDGHRLLDGVSLSIGPGRVVALIGPNGAGKSTFLKLLAGDLAATSGSVRIGGRPPRSWPSREIARHRAVMSQDHSVTFSFTVRESVAMGRSPHDKSDADASIIEDSLESGELQALANRDVTTLSGGELARTVFSRVLAQTARVVLLDEPTAALDLRHQELLMSEASRVAHAGGCVLTVLHDLNLAARYADEIALFAEGRLVTCGTPADVLTAERIAAVYGQEVQVLAHPVSGRPLVVPVSSRARTGR